MNATDTRVVAPKQRKSERRQWDRIPIPMPVFIRGTDVHGKAFLEFASALNVSAGGLLIASKRHLPLFSNVSLEIPSAPLPYSGLAGSMRVFKARLVHQFINERCQCLGFEFLQPLLPVK